MATVRHKIGSLREIIDQLRGAGVSPLHTLDDIRAFWANYDNETATIKKSKRKIVDSDIAALKDKHRDLTDKVQKFVSERASFRESKIAEVSKLLRAMPIGNNFMARILNWFRKRRLEEQLSYLKNRFDTETSIGCAQTMRDADVVLAQINDRMINIETWVERLSERAIYQLRQTKAVLDRNKSYFYGAEGEASVCAELMKLPATYTVINDYRRSFRHPVYDRKNDDKIFSIQVDHVVVGPTGIFLIETKNWSKEFVNGNTAFSPVDQLRRASFAMFIVLNQAVTDSYIKGFSKNWGAQQISPKNIVASLKYKTKEDFRFVKVLSLEELRNYITYGENVYTTDAVNSLVEYLVSTGE